jgi:uncharacterized membrane protein
MNDTQKTRNLLRSIKNALWLIAAILLMQLGFNLDDFKSTPMAEIIMLLGFWGGFLLMFCILIGLLAAPFSKPDEP